MDETTRQSLRQLPSVDELLRDFAADSLVAEYSRDRVVEAVREAVAATREEIVAGAGGRPEAEAVLARAAALLRAWAAPHLRRVLNASGVVVHTNLGRSRLAEAAIDRMIEVARNYSNLEYDLGRGDRGSRHDHVGSLLTRLTGAEAAMVVNNNAAAVLLLVSGLAEGREVIVSRGQLVEIGGAFRIPDIVRLSGARLVEVGTTNKTRLQDYVAAIGADTGLLLRVHTSNFKMLGFTEEVGIDELAHLAHERDLSVADDVGSGALVALPAFRDEPSATASLAAGADVVCCSGDKLLGGPQAGILLGRRKAIDALKRHPLARAVRVDKMTLAALEGTLLLYQEPESARTAIPVLRYMSRTPEETRSLADALAAALAAACGASLDLAVEETTGKAGGGALPLLELPSHAVVVRPAAGAGGRPVAGVAGLEEGLRRAPLPVVARVAQDAVYLDVLTLERDELPLVAEAVAWALARATASAAL